MSPLTEHEIKLQKASLWYAKQGWKLLPCHGITDQGRCTCNGTHNEPKDVGKHPAIKAWDSQASSEEATVSSWWNTTPQNNIGVVCNQSGFIVIDVDPRSGGLESYEKLLEVLEGDLPLTVEAYTGTYHHKGSPVRGRHIFYRVSDGLKFVGNLKAQGMPGIDIEHNGYVMLAPSRHVSGVNYEWVSGKAPWEIEMAEISEPLLKLVRKGGSSGAMSKYSSSDWGWVNELEYRGEKIDIDKILEEGIDEGERAVKIYALACAIANKLGVENQLKKQAVENLLLRFNHENVRPPLELDGPNSVLMHTRRAIAFVEENPVTEKMWPGLTDWAERSNEESRNLAIQQRLQNEAQRSVTEAAAAIKTGDEDEVVRPTSSEIEVVYGTIGGDLTMAARSGLSISEAFSSGAIDLPKDVDALSEQEGGEIGRRSLSDTGNGRRLVDSFGNSIRYTPGMGWFIWDGQYWKPDLESLGMQELAKKLPPIIATEVIQYDEPDKKNEVIKWAQSAKTNAKLSAAIENANSDERILAPVEAWDSDVYMLGVANGVVDLRTGELLKGRPDLFITKRAPVAYTQGMRNIRWEQFIDFATGGDKELQDWLQRAAGYTLTGLNNQDIMLLVYGPPGSGKNTFVEALVKALGTKQYAWPMDSNVLAQGDGMSSSTDLYHWAELRGRRMVWVDELPESERMKENAVKKLTGSSEISARSPGEKPFTFNAQAKLWVTTNHRPQINDDAMWRRIRPVPWVNVPESPDPDLKAYLFDPEGGLPAILSWMVEGAIKYLGSSARDPLGWCTAVKEAAEIYRKNEDRLGMFLEEETKPAEGSSIPVKALYSVYRMWSEDRGERPVSQIRFHKTLADRGLSIEGQGARALIKDYVLIPKAVPSSEGINWDSVSRLARF